MGIKTKKSRANACHDTGKALINAVQRLLQGFSFNRFIKREVYSEQIWLAIGKYSKVDNC